MNMGAKIVDISTKEDISSAKIPPYCSEAEQSVLGGLMIDNDSWDDISSLITEDCFYKAEHKIIFNAIGKFLSFGKPADILLVIDHIKGIGKLAYVGGESYIMCMAKDTPSTANIVAYAEIVRGRSIARQLIKASSEISHMSYKPDGKDCDELVDMAEQKIFNLSTSMSSNDKQKSISELSHDALKAIDYRCKHPNEINGIGTGIKVLDGITGGLKKDNLIVLAARPSMGKTMLAVNIAQRLCLNTDKSALIFSMEMSSDEVMFRMISSISDIEHEKVSSSHEITKEEWAKLGQASTSLSESKIKIDDSPALTPNELRSRARRYAREAGRLDLIVVDYLQLMRSNKQCENRVTEISEISRSLKTLSKEMHVPVIALSQLNRGLESRADKKPVMSDLRDSGAIEQDADLILFIYRDYVYNPQIISNKDIADVILSKNRNGPTGSVKLKFQGKYMRFT